jgi:hypothetical protein
MHGPSRLAHSRQQTADITMLLSCKHQQEAPFTNLKARFLQRIRCCLRRPAVWRDGQIVAESGSKPAPGAASAPMPTLARQAALTSNIWWCLVSIKSPEACMVAFHCCELCHCLRGQIYDMMLNPSIKNLVSMSCCRLLSQKERLPTTMQHHWGTRRTLRSSG